MSSFQYQVRSGESLHGRNEQGENYTITFDEGALSLAFANASTTHSIPLKKGVSNTRDVSTKISQQSPECIKLKVLSDHPILRSQNHIDPDTADTPAKQIWLEIQEYLLKDDESDDAHEALLDLLEGELPETIEESHPDEESALNAIFNYAEGHRIIAAIIETRELAARLDGPVPALQPAATP